MCWHYNAFFVAGRLAPRGLIGGLLRCARKDGVAFAKTEWGSQRRCGGRNDGVAVRNDALLSLRGRRPWQSMVEHCGVCEVDCFAALAKTEWRSQ